MRSFYYDLHLHSCLSPCGDREMTPANIAGMAKLNNLSLLALTDHNSTGNCRAFCEACRRYGIVPIAGMELTTAEDVHLITLFPSLASAREFDSALQSKRILYPNRPEIFGEQLLVDENDKVLGKEDHLLPNATTLSLEEACQMARDYGALVYPAHIDRESNGVISVLGGFPPEPGFTCYELHDGTKKAQYEATYGLSHLRSVTSSDAHVLWDIAEGVHALDLEGESEEEIRASLFRLLGGTT